MKEIRQLHNLLEKYERVFGQEVNISKIAMVFSKNVSPMKQNEIMEFWGVNSLQQYDKYLGLLHTISRTKSKVFSMIKHKV